MPKLSYRLEKIYSELTPVKTFADVGCDHGYIAEAMLENGKCEKAIISDISKSSLKKAEDLLESKFPKKFISIVADGFSGLPEFDEALIAGMGGEEIIKIISEAKFTPEFLVLQPMKNTDKVRRFLLISGYKLIKDYTFKADGKFYDLIKAVKADGKDVYTEKEILYGRDNLTGKNSDFSDYLSIKLSVLKDADINASDKTKTEIEEKISEIEGIIDENSRIL